MWIEEHLELILAIGMPIMLLIGWIKCKVDAKHGFGTFDNAVLVTIAVTCCIILVVGLLGLWAYCVVSVLLGKV